MSSLDSDLDLSDSDYGLLDPHSIYDESYALNIAARHDEEDLYSHGKTYLTIIYHVK